MKLEDNRREEPEKVGASIKIVNLERLVVIAAFVGIIALSSLILCFSIDMFEPSRQVMLTFWISFLVGLGGAGVYLSLLLMTEKHLKILENSLTSDLGLMIFIFLLSGGLLAAVIQVSTGTLVAGSLQAVFMLGFGWLGALSGVAGTSTRAQLSAENRKLDSNKKEAEKERDSILQGLTNENKDLKGKLEEAYALIAKSKGRGE